MADPQRPPLAADIQASGGVLNVAVFHRSDEVDRHVAALSEVAAIRLDLVWQGTTWALPAGAHVLLWELAPEDGSDRRVAALARSAPAVSYSSTLQPDLVELSR